VKPQSLIWRVVVGQVLVIISFVFLASLNLVFQQSETGLDAELKASAVSLAKALDNKIIESKNIAQDFDLLATGHLGLVETLATGRQISGQFQYIIELLDPSGRRLYSNSKFTQITLPAPSELFQSFRAENIDWRVASSRAPKSAHTVLVAESRDAYFSQTVATLRDYVFFPFLLFIPIAILFTWLATRRSLKPLNDLADLISRRGQFDLEMIKSPISLKETKPVVEALNSLFGKLKHSLERERNFLADAAHELRTPLAVVQAQMHLLEKEQDGPHRKTAFLNLQAGVDRASALVKNMLLNARLSEETLRPKRIEVELNSFLQLRIASFSALALEKQIELELVAPNVLFIELDPEMFSCAIDCLLDNAVRYGNEAGRVLVIAKISDNDRVTVSISDNGVGAPKAQQDLLLKRFYRVAGTGQAGTGLGLAIVERIVSLHGGKISISDGFGTTPAGLGLTVELDLPLSFNA
jgi:two-component system, OmpR family, sensor histidine kinase QseC